MEEDVSIHFDWEGSSPYMLYFQKVKDPALQAVTHEDGTARVQTVSELQNKAAYGLLKEFKRQTGKSVLCNTSLNFKGKGFINRKSCLIDFAKTNMIRYLVINDKLFIHQGTRSQ
jgi:hydroxymethyl cephem carbamoyltransferase